VPQGAHQLLPAARDNKEGWTTSTSLAGSATRCKSRWTSSAAIHSGRAIVLDLVLFLDLAQRAGMRGIQEWLSFYFKSPMTAPGCTPSTISSFSP